MYVCTHPCKDWHAVFTSSKYGWHRTTYQTDRWRVYQNPNEKLPGRVYVSIQSVQIQESGRYWICADKTGKDACLKFEIEVKRDGKMVIYEDRGEVFKIDDSQNRDPRATPVPSVVSNVTRENESKKLKIMIVAGETGLRQLYEKGIPTGGKGANTWLAWMMYTARSMQQTNCYTCAGARPQLVPVPFPLNWDRTPRAMTCILQLFTNPLLPKKMRYARVIITYFQPATTIRRAEGKTLDLLHLPFLLGRRGLSAIQEITQRDRTWGRCSTAIRRIT